MKSNNDHDHSLRQHLKYLLSDGGAHVKFSDVVSSFPAKLRGQKPSGFPHSAWMLLEHMRIVQWDILEFSRNPKYARRSGRAATGLGPRTRLAQGPGAPA